MCFAVYVPGAKISPGLKIACYYSLLLYLIHINVENVVEEHGKVVIAW
jgi:hypothetical protein